MTGRDAETRTAFLGRFDPLLVPVILDVMAEHGIFAMTKVMLDQPSGEAYPFLNEGRREILVDAARIDEARRLVEFTVPRRLAELRADLEVGEGWEGEVPAIADNFVPLGWMEPGVARVFLEIMAEAEIGAAAEYPLDRPPPPYARADGRVRVHVEELFLADAQELLATDVEEILRQRGISFREPIVDLDEP